MIDIKAISKPKQSGSSSSSVSVVQSAATATTAKRADLADKATWAERAAWADGADMAQRAAYASTAEETAHASEADHAKEAGNALAWQGEEFASWLAQPVRPADEVAFASLTSADIRSAASIADGITGSGFHLRCGSDGVARLDVDELTVRQTMRIMELLISKVRSTGGQIVASAANGKVKEASKVGSSWFITWETANTFQPHDLMRCQTFTGAQQRSYWVEVQSVMAEGVVVDASEFGSASPMAGDECVLMGNTLDKARQGLALISASDDGTPRFDVMDGICSKTLSGCLHARMGKLDGISDAAFPAADQPQGYGLYADNAYLRGTFVLSTGEDVLTRIKAAEGKIESSVESIRQDLTPGESYLDNADFSRGLTSWQTDTGAVFFVAGSRWIITGDKPLAMGGEKVKVVKDQGRTAVRIRSSYIRQRDADMASRPEGGGSLDDGKLKASPVYVSFFYRCAKAGTLTIYFTEEDKERYEEYDTLGVEEVIGVTDGYVQANFSGMWNGKGSFVLAFTGEIYISMLVASSDKAESLAYKYQSLFNMSSELVNIATRNFDRDGNVLQESGIMMSADFLSYFTKQWSEVYNASGFVTTANFGALFTESFEESTGKLDFSTVVTTPTFGTLFTKSLEEATGKLDFSTVVTTSTFGALFSKSFDAAVSSSAMAGFVTTSDFEKFASDNDINYNYVRTLVNNLEYDMGKKMDVTAFSGMFAEAKDADSDLVKRADIATFITKDYDGFMQSNAIIKADQIRLEGIVTANKNFKVNTDGSIEAMNARLEGYLRTRFRKLADSEGVLVPGKGVLLVNDLCVDATAQTVVLPVSSAYEGARVTVLDSYFHKSRKAQDPTVIITSDGSEILGGMLSRSEDYDYYCGKADSLTIDAGTVELALQNCIDKTDASGVYAGSPLRWVVIGCTCRVLQWTVDGKTYRREFWPAAATVIE